MAEREVPEWFVERLAAGDLSTEEAARLRARLEARGELHRLDAIEASNREVLAAHPPARVAAEVERRRPRPAWRFALPAVALATLALGIGLRSREPIAVTADDGVRVKGLAPHVVIYRKTASNPELVTAATPVHAGDTLQVAYVAAGRRYGVVASLDARGTVTLHLPEASASAVSLAQGETPLPHAFELDDSPGFERFVFVTADQPFSTDEVVASLRPGGPPLRGDLSSSDVILRKVTP